MTHQPIPMQPLAIVGGGPVGLALSLALARAHVPSVVFDARTVEQASADRRLLALSQGSLQTLAALATLPQDKLGPIHSVSVSSAGQFGRALIDRREHGVEMLGATVRYGDLTQALSAAAAASTGLITVRRPHAVRALHQSPSQVAIELDGGQQYAAPLVLNAEGFAADTRAEPAAQAALIADLELAGIERGRAHERFTRDGPLALLPLPGRAASSTFNVALVWCMSNAQAERRGVLSDEGFIAELEVQLSERKLRVLKVQSRQRYALNERTRDQLVEHRIVHLGNAAQTLHPVAGQGLNLGLRDGAVLAARIAELHAVGRDPVGALQPYAEARRADRAAISALTRLAPGFFSTRFTPVAAARSAGLTALAVVPKLRREFTRLLMFGVRF